MHYKKGLERSKCCNNGEIVSTVAIPAQLWLKNALPVYCTQQGPCS
jgi:hypothetical protein